MVEESINAPANYKGVMVSGTFSDLKWHRAELMQALDKEKLHSIGMENYVPNPADDVISSSLGMVRDGTAYICLISHRYGQVPEDVARNPHAYSVTRVEFEEAQNLGRPTLVFIMGDAHPVTVQDIETDAEKRSKLEDFRARGKEGRIYVTFDNLEEFTRKAIHAVAELRRYLDEQHEATSPLPEAPYLAPDPTASKIIPVPPTFYAEPPYIGLHDFVGRQAELEKLNDWAKPANSHPVLLFEAIGGSGKSMLTWEWVNKHATQIRQDWAGRFWYSFYEKGASMASFCRYALAYITGQAPEDFVKMKTPELGELLLQHLRARPWLIVLDGLERMLVTYHRFDAAQITDDEAGNAVDQIASRDPCSAIRPEDDDLLRVLAGASPSKLLLTSRLVPRALLNPSNQTIPGVLPGPLPGLRPADAEALLVSCGVNGDSDNIQNYLQSHCDCHPLVIGVLAGLIVKYLPSRGNFDAWAADSNGGGALNLGDLDLTTKRNHILQAALAALPERGLQLLSTLALISEAIDSPTLLALNPHLPPEPEKVEQPTNPETGSRRWRSLSMQGKERAKKDYSTRLEQWKQYQQACEERQESAEFLTAPLLLEETVRDLERRGLLQYDRQSQRHDLHPVVRSVVARRLRPEDTERYGQRVVDHFSQHVPTSYDRAESIEELSSGLHLVRALLHMGRYKQSCNTLRGGLCNALLTNVEANDLVLSLLQPFFPQSWATLPKGLQSDEQSSLLNAAAVALHNIGKYTESLAVGKVSIQIDLAREDWQTLIAVLNNRANTIGHPGVNHLAESHRYLKLTLELASEMDDASLFSSRAGYLSSLARIGNWVECEDMWQLMDAMGRAGSSQLITPGSAEHTYAWFRFWQGNLTEEHLLQAEEQSRTGVNRNAIRWTHRLRGVWQLEQGRYELAIDSLQESVRMARDIGDPAAGVETFLALARFHLGELADPRGEAERLAEAKQPFDRVVSELWLAIGDRKQAKKHALAAYRWAWADGEPYVWRYELDKARALLEQLGV